MISFYTNGNSFSLPTENTSSEILLVDDKDNEYNIFGSIVSGPDLGDSLEKTESFIAYWFAFPAFYEQVSIHEFE